MTTTRTRAGDDASTIPARPNAQHRNEITIVGELIAPLEARQRADGTTVLSFRLAVRTPISAGGAVVPAEKSGSASTARRDVIDCVVMAGPVRRRLEQYHPADTVEAQGALRHRFFNAGGRVQSRYEVEVVRLKRVGRATGVRSGQSPDPPG
jgi:single-strand DNA-binding protein